MQCVSFRFGCLQEYTDAVVGDLASIDLLRFSARVWYTCRKWHGKFEGVRV
jgi:hypothetical protein